MRYLRWHCDFNMFIHLICSHSGKMFEISGYGSVMEGQKVQAIYERPVFFFGTHSPPTRRIGPGRKPCENFDPFRKRAPALFVFGSVDWARNRSSWTAGNQPISVNCGNFWGGFGKVSEVFGFGALWSFWGKGTTYYLSRVLCFCCEIQSVFFVNVKEPKEMRILQKWLLTLIFVLHICSKDKSGN